MYNDINFRAASNWTGFCVLAIDSDGESSRKLLAV